MLRRGIPPTAFVSSWFRESNQTKSKVLFAQNIALFTERHQMSFSNSSVRLSSHSNNNSSNSATGAASEQRRGLHGDATRVRLSATAEHHQQQHRHHHHEAAFTDHGIPQPGVMARTHLPIPDFKDKNVYSRKSTPQLLRGIFTLYLCRVDFLVKNAIPILQGFDSFYSKTLRMPKSTSEYLVYNTFVKWVMFKHFCGGTDAEDIKPVLADLEKAGIGAILDYAAEAEVPQGVLFKPEQDIREEPIDVSMKSLVNRQDLKYCDKEAQYDENVKIFLSCIDAGRGGFPKERVCFSAIKLTGLVEPQLLARIASILLSLRQGWVKIFTNDPAPRNLEDCRVVTGRQMKVSSRFVSIEQFKKGLRTVWKKDTTEEQREAFVSYLIEQARVTAPHNHQPQDEVDYLVYANTIARALLSHNAPAAVLPMLAVLPGLTEEELNRVDRFLGRTKVIAERAKEKNVYLMVDAEQTFYQMAIDHFVREMQRDYNRQTPLIYNTYQTYLTIAEDRLRNDLARAEREGWLWAGKMVRGAYMLQERTTAEKYGYASPIHATQKDTDRCFENCAQVIMEHIRTTPYSIGVNFGSHNVQSCEYVCKLMQELPMANSKSIISFGQLYGMADYLSLPLARSGYLVYKYVPYGPVKECVEYLGRRALENNAVAMTSTKDSQCMWYELKKCPATWLFAFALMAIFAVWMNALLIA